jgi:sulfopyruvate decarboxylase subunit alpha
MNVRDQNAFYESDSGRSKKADEMHQVLMDFGVNFASGGPCGVLKHIIRNLHNDPAVLDVPANRESEAVGLAAGAYLAGRIPLVYMQNSGLFAASNDIASLLIPYRIPVFFVVSYRGCEGEDAVQHLTTGQATESLLRSFDLPFAVFEGQDLGVLVGLMFEAMKAVELPAFLLLKRGWHK